ncbi:MAG: 4-hydroxythreonine-4-phosphate dehydrogenase PdxA [Candidatus Brocadiales bacterium]
MAKKNRQTIGITMGDPCGVGPEVALKALAALAKGHETVDAILIGSMEVFQETAGVIGISPGDLENDNLSIRVLGTEDPFDVKRMYERPPTTAAGSVSVKCVLRGIEMALSGEIDALVTAPISKEAMRMAGYPYPGHTEILKECTGSDKVVMMMIGGNLRVSFVTIHVPLREVVDRVNTANVFSSIMITADGLERFFAIPRPEQRIGVCALNPHAGEGGLMGPEEGGIILPAVELARKEGIGCSGPVASDVIFRRAVEGEFDAVVCMYHDQGAIPVKLLTTLDSGVNLTLGLPIVRTSPTHGTAFDIAGRGVANPGSMLEAIKLANRLAAVPAALNRGENAALTTPL